MGRKCEVPSSRQPLRLGAVLDPLVQRLGIATRVRQEQAVFLWPDVAGRSIARKTRAVYARDGILFVNTDSSTWAHQLTLMKSTFLQGYRERLGSDIIKEIHFRTGEARTKPTDTRNTKRWEEKDKNVPPSQEDVLFAEVLSRDLPEPGLSTAFKRSIISARQTAKSREAMGWDACASCAVRHPRVTKGLCPFCRAEFERSVREAELRLTAEPWLAPSEMPGPVGQRDMVHSQAKATLASEWEKEAMQMLREGRAAKAKTTVLNLALLLSGKSPLEIREEDLRVHLTDRLLGVWLLRIDDSERGRV